MKPFAMASSASATEKSPSGPIRMTISSDSLPARTSLMLLRGVFSSSKQYAISFSADESDLVRNALANPIDSPKLEELVKDNKLYEHITSVEDILSSYPKVTIKSAAEKLLLNGNKFNLNSVVPSDLREDVRVYDTNDRFVALYSYDNKYREYKPMKMFL